VTRLHNLRRSKMKTLRCSSGQSKNSRNYIPRIHENGDYVFGSRCFSILQLKSGGLSFSRNDSRKAGLKSKRVAWLQSNYGLSYNQARILLSRSDPEIRRIEETIHGIMDSLLLFDMNLFLTKENIKRVRGIIRKTLKIGTYNIGQVVRYWKDFSDFIYNRVAKMDLVLPLPNKENYFVTFLLSYPKIQRLINSDVDKYLLESFAHLTSSRQLPAGDGRAMEKALDTFFINIEEPYPFSGYISVAYQIAMRIGEKCLSLGGGKTTHPHISLSCAGSYYKTILDGGRGSEIREALEYYLPYRPEKDEVIETPFGQLNCPAGEERFRHWCRPVPYKWYLDVPFGKVLEEERFLELHPFFQGFDEAIGRQIVVVAFLEYEAWTKTKQGIPCRVMAVPEPGFKSRIVTTGPFWLNVLQQGLAHTIKDILSVHPSVRSSLQKTDQAWQSLYLMTGKDYPKDFLCLSSDLKEATDHIPKIIAVQLLSGFIAGSGLKSNLSETCLDLLRINRTFISPTRISLSQTRGAMMGEPLTKVILSILNLVVEEFAMRKHLGIGYGEPYYDSPKWRTYHVGGDDHLAIGPKDYLDAITYFHLKCGSHISPGKHGQSSICVKYCEKVLDIRNIYERFDVRRINDNTKTYESSPFVDSIKVRLLSPTSKAFDVISDRNVAIGKGQSLGRTLKWLNRDHFSLKWVRMVRNRFFERMGSLLPDRSSGVYWQLMMPGFWGGLDLYLPDEIEDLYGHLPELTLSIMSSYLHEEPQFDKDLSLLQKFLSNYSYRGYRLNETDVEAMQQQLELIITNQVKGTWSDLQKQFNPDGTKSAQEVSSLSYADSWRTDKEIIDELLRPVLFREILLGKEKLAVFNTINLKTRYARLWDLVYRGLPNITFEEFKTTLKTRPKGMFYRTGYPEGFTFYSDRGFLFTSLLDDALNGMPVLSIGYPYS